MHFFTTKYYIYSYSQRPHMKLLTVEDAVCNQCRMFLYRTSSATGDVNIEPSHIDIDIEQRHLMMKVMRTFPFQRVVSTRNRIT